MKDLKSKAQELGAEEILTREELKEVSVIERRGGCTAIIHCLDGNDKSCSCDSGTCSTTDNGVVCDCDLPDNSAFGSGVIVTLNCSDDGSGSSGGGSGSGSGSSGGGSGSGSGGGGGFSVQVTNNASLPVTIKIDSVNYTCPVQATPYTVPVTINTGNHIFNFSCLVAGVPVYYTLDGTPAACATDISKYVNANVRLRSH